MMHLTSATCHAIYIILMQIILTSAANDEFSRIHNISSSFASHENSGRSKRSLFEKMPTRLRIRVRYITGEEIDLTWSKKKQYLANRYLSVITSSGYPLPTAMNDVGEFVIYQDPKKCSAVVYFEKFKTLFGVIGMNYYIADLPYLFDETGKYPGVVGEPYVKKHEYSLVHNLPQIPDMFLNQLMDPVSHDSHQFPEPSFDSNPGPTSKRQRTERNFEQRSNEILTSEEVSNTNIIRNRRRSPQVGEYYLEILNLVTKNVAEIFKESWGDYFIEWLVRYYIIYFNAVDMMFRKLRCSDDALLINIAKIVIEDNETPFDSSGNNQLMENLPQYLDPHNVEYPRDSFDHVFIFTSQQIMDNSVPVHGFTKFDTNLYEARKRGEFYQAVPKTLIGFVDHYVSAVHEISKTFKFEIDPWDEGVGQIGQCNSLMQQGSSKCDECLKWSHSSQEHLNNFLSKDQHRCFLMNTPRSIQPPQPFVTSSPNKQCQCFGYDSYYKYPNGDPKFAIPIADCSKPLPCIKAIDGQEHVEDTVQPFDGTRCTTSQKMVCWKGKCKRAI